MEMKYKIIFIVYIDVNIYVNEFLDWLIGNRLISFNVKVKVKRIIEQGYIIKDLWKILIRFEIVDYKLMIILQVVCCLLKLRYVLSLKEIKCIKLSIYIVYKYVFYDVVECVECYNVCFFKKYGN